jgi:hypothetical protein
VSRFNQQPESSGFNNAVTQHTPERFVDANALAEHLGVTRRQVLEMTRRGIIPGHPLGIGTNRKVWRYKISEVEAALAARARSTRLSDVAGIEESARRTMPLGSSPSQRRKSNG